MVYSAGDAFGGDVDPVDDQVVPAGFHRQVDDLGQRQGPAGEDLDAFLAQGAAGAFRDTVALTQLPVGVSALQPGDVQDRLGGGVMCPPAGGCRYAVGSGSGQRRGVPRRALAWTGPDRR